MTRFGLTFGVLTNDEKTFFKTLLGFMPYWVYKTTNVFHSKYPGLYTSEKNVNLSTRNKNHLKSDIIGASVINGVRQPIVFSFDLDKNNRF